MKLISIKSIFASLIIIIILSFIINIISNDNDSSKNKVLDRISKDNKNEKILGVRIRQQNKKGDKYLIVAESLIESNSTNKKVILENSLTTIEQNGIFTKIYKRI